MIKNSIEIGKKVPNFTFNATNNLHGCLNDYANKTLLLYFYPKDSTPGCTTQGVDFKEAYETLKSRNVEVFGVSRDSLKSHERFKSQYNFPFELISDSDETLCQLFDVIKMKMLYGKQVRGIERSTFIINPQQLLVYEWRKVSVPGHVNEVISALDKI